MGEDWGRTQAREPPGCCAPGDYSQKPSSQVGRARKAAVGARSEGRAVWFSRGLCRRWLPRPAPPGVSQTESRSCQTLRRVK